MSTRYNSQSRGAHAREKREEQRVTFPGPSDTLPLQPILTSYLTVMEKIHLSMNSGV